MASGRCVRCGATVRVSQRDRLLGAPICGDCLGVTRRTSPLASVRRAMRGIKWSGALAAAVGAGTFLLQLHMNRARDAADADRPSLSADLDRDRDRADEWPAAAKPPKLIRTALGSSDYPVAALRAGHEGTTRVRLLVSSTGALTDCAVVDGSGSAALDRAACKGLRRSTFEPALDGSGKPVDGTISTAVRWELPS